MKKWIWQQKNYLNFTYDSQKLENLIQKVSIEQGYLIALSQTMDNKTIIQRQIESLENEAINTSLIEGVSLNRDSVKASIAKKFGFEDIDYKKVIESTDNLIEIIIDANTNYNIGFVQPCKAFLHITYLKTDTNNMDRFYIFEHQKIDLSTFEARVSLKNKLNEINQELNIEFEKLKYYIFKRYTIDDLLEKFVVYR